MKRIDFSNFRLAILGALIAFSPLLVDASSPPVFQTKDVLIGLNDVYVPGGFDSQTEAFVVANGLFPNGCYKWRSADVSHVDAFDHEIRSYASVTQGMCIMVLVPFHKEIRLGKLGRGTHSLKFISGDGTFLQKSMSIE